ncbi:hypothetical protein V6N13_072064 [Hibiscus sabdariffa]
MWSAFVVMLRPQVNVQFVLRKPNMLIMCYTIVPWLGEFSKRSFLRKKSRFGTIYLSWNGSLAISVVLAASTIREKTGLLDFRFFVSSFGRTIAVLSLTRTLCRNQT